MMYVCENNFFIAEVKRLQKLVANDQVDSVKQELSKLQQYSVKLERQIKLSLTSNELKTNEASLSMEEYTQLTSEVERLGKKCKQLQNQLSTVSIDSYLLFFLPSLITGLSLASFNSNLINPSINPI